MAEKTLTYKQSHKLEERIKRVKEQLDKYPNMVPIIVERGKKCKLPQLDRIKYFKHLHSGSLSTRSSCSTISDKP